MYSRSGIPYEPSDRSLESTKWSEESIKSKVDVGDGGEFDLPFFIIFLPHPSNRLLLIVWITRVIHSSHPDSILILCNIITTWVSFFSALFPHSASPSFLPPFTQQSAFTCPFLWQLKHSMLFFNPFPPFHGFLDPLQHEMQCSCPCGSIRASGLCVIPRTLRVMVTVER